MRFLVKAFDNSEEVDYGEFSLSEKQAKMILEARKVLLDLRERKILGEDELLCIRFNVGQEIKVKYFSAEHLGSEPREDAALFDEPLLSKEQWERLEHLEYIDVPDDFKLHTRYYKGEDVTYAWTDMDCLMIEEQVFYFESRADEYQMSTTGILYDVLNRII